MSQHAFKRAWRNLAVALLLTAPVAGWGATGSAPVPAEAGAASAPAVVPAPPPQGLVVSNARIRWLPGDLPLAGYFSLRNDSDRNWRLVGARGEAFHRVMIHQSLNGSMRHLDVLGVPAHGSVEFAPGGYHLMLMGRQRDIAEGDQVTLVLDLVADNAGSQALPSRLPVTFVVRGARTQ